MKKYFSIGLKCIIILAGLFGITSGLFKSRTVMQLFSYYTILSNLLTIVVMILAVIAEFQNKTFCPFVKKGTTVCIVLTFLVYHFALSPAVSPEAFWSFDNLCVHYIVTLGAFIDYLIFDKKGNLKIYQPTIWASFPIIYYCYILIYGAFGGYFLDKGQPIELATKAPYWFIDIEGKIPNTDVVMGVKGVIIAVALVTLGFLILSYLLYLIDIGLNALNNKKVK